MSFIVAIPARYSSQRLPGKPLIPVAGKPIIQHVHERAVEAKPDQIIIATDDARIEACARGFGANVRMTSAAHASGTDRIAELAGHEGWPDDGIVVNLQGDEPLMPPVAISQVAETLAAREDADIATLSAPIYAAAELRDPNVVKVVCDASGLALYFSRSVIPYPGRESVAPVSGLHYRHIGIYAYRVGYLKSFSRFAPPPLEQTERLEQLRALWHGGRIVVTPAGLAPPPGVDTNADLERVARLLSPQ
ncbi:MAG: 3-deoxy-manno-octulosonate cytidylyltransferase [Gammaproteobacteria bacterium]